MRKHFLDNLRWGTVLLVLVYHVFYLYNSLGVPGGIGSFYPVQPWDVFMTVIYPWLMVLLFVVAGISASYALEGQTPGAFLRSRTRKLLVPATLGLLVYQLPVGIINLKVGGGWDLIPVPVNYLVAVLVAVGPLWFAQVLWVLSLLLVLIRRIPGTAALPEKLENIPVWGLVLLFLPVWGASHILNAPRLSTYRFGIYGLAFFLGYLILSREAVQRRLEKWHPVLLLLALGAGGAYALCFRGQNFAGDGVLQHVLTNLYLWLAVLALLGCGRARWNGDNAFARYMTRSSFGIYVVHYLIALLLCLGLRASPLPPAADYCLAILGVLILSPLVYEILRRIPVIRYITFGVRKEKSHVS